MSIRFPGESAADRQARNKLLEAELSLLSASGNAYQQDYHGEDAEGRQLPICDVFVRRDGHVHHFWCSEMFFADSPCHPRHVDLLFPLWNHLDLTPEGRGTFFPSLTYQE